MGGQVTLRPDGFSDDHYVRLRDTAAYGAALVG